jgi:hypothetical protein
MGQTLQLILSAKVQAPAYRACCLFLPWKKPELLMRDSMKQRGAISVEGTGLASTDKSALRLMTAHNAGSASHACELSRPGTQVASLSSYLVAASVIKNIG